MAQCQRSVVETLIPFSRTSRRAFPLAATLDKAVGMKVNFYSGAPSKDGLG